MWAIYLAPITALAITVIVLLREQLRLSRQMTQMRWTMTEAIERVDDHLDELGLVFSDLAEAPTPGQIERAEVGLISLMDDLMRVREAV